MIEPTPSAIDPTVAALLGAAIGAVAAVLAGIVGPGLISRGEGRRALREAQRQEIGSVLTALADLLRARHTLPRGAEFFELHTIAVVAITRLNLLVSKRDHRGIARVTGFTLDTVSADEVSDILDLSLTSCTYVLEKWYLGEIHGEKIEAEYGKLISVDLSQPDWNGRVPDQRASE